MKTVIDIKRKTWANVKHFATVKNVPLSHAVETLLKKALANFGYQIENTGDTLDG